MGRFVPTNRVSSRFLSGAVIAESTEACRNSDQLRQQGSGACKRGLLWRCDLQGETSALDKTNSDKKKVQSQQVIGEGVRFYEAKHLAFGKHHPRNPGQAQTPRKKRQWVGPQAFAISPPGVEKWDAFSYWKLPEANECEPAPFFPSLQANPSGPTCFLPDRAREFFRKILSGCDPLAGFVFCETKRLPAA